MKHLMVLFSLLLLLGAAACNPEQALSEENAADSTGASQDVSMPTEAPEPVETSASTLVSESAESGEDSMHATQSIDLPFIPHDIAIGPDGNIYAVELGAPLVHKLNNEGELLASWGASGSEAGQFAFSPPPDGPPLDGGFLVVGQGGKVYVSDSYNNRVQIFDSDGEFLEIWDSYGPENTMFNNLGPISVDGNGSIFVADFNGLHHFDAQGNYVGTVGGAGEVAFDSQGNLYTTVAFENIAMKIPAGGGEPHVWGEAGTENGQFQTPIWVVATEDSVYISDHSGRVQKFDSQGNFISVWSGPSDGLGRFTGPATIAQDSQGNIYVSAKDRPTIYVIQP